MARTRSGEKRREIIQVAAEAFQELGYERTSMLTIAERMRGSKQTLYNYFPSKEDLLRAVLDFDVGEVADQAMEEFVAEKSLRKGLARLGEIYLARQLNPRAISNFRIVATQLAEFGHRRGVLPEHPVRRVDAGRRRIQVAHGRRQASPRRPMARRDALQGSGAPGPARKAALERSQAGGSQGSGIGGKACSRRLLENLWAG